MKLEQLASHWKRHPPPLADGQFDTLVARVVSLSSWFERAVLRRDLLETLTGLLVLPPVLFVLLRFEMPRLAAVGLGITVTGVAAGLIVLHVTRWRGARVGHDIPLNKFCATKIRRLDQQIWLLENVNWWYTGPAVLGCCVFTLGVLLSFRELPSWLFAAILLLFFLIYFLAAWSLYRSNRRTVESDYLPVRVEMAELLEVLQRDSEERGPRP